MTLCTGDLGGENPAQELHELFTQADAFAESHREFHLAVSENRLRQSPTNLWAQSLFWALDTASAPGKGLREALDESQAQAAFPTIRNLRLSREDGDANRSVMLHISLMYHEGDVDGLAGEVTSKYKNTLPDRVRFEAIQVVTPRSGDWKDILNGKLSSSQRSWDVVYAKKLPPAAPARPLRMVISGGQTGVDQAAWRAARSTGLLIGGWCPPGRDNGEDPDTHEPRPAVPLEFPCLETPENTNAAARNIARGVRTQWNVRDSDATLVLLYRQREAASNDPGTQLTIDTAKERERTVLIVDMTDIQQVSQVVQWIRVHDVRTLNVGGPAEDMKYQGEIGSSAERFLFAVFAQVRNE
jgi:hypothetical protein